MFCESFEASFRGWMMRVLLLIPVIQILGVVFTIRRVRRWRQDPPFYPSWGRLWGLHILLPLIPNLLLLAIPLFLLAKNWFGFLLLFAPDFSWIALICGGFAGIWACLRTRLVLVALGRLPSHQTIVGRLSSEPKG